MESFGNRLKDKRKARQLTQIEISKMLNISQGTYAGYETDKHKPDIDTLVRIAEVLETSTDYLLGRYRQ